MRRSGGWRAPSVWGAAVLAAGLVLAGCGSGTTRATTAGTNSTLPAGPPTTDERGVAAAVVGVLGAEGRLCPTSQPGCPSAIVVEGEMGDVPEGERVRGVGWYDGRRLLLSAPLEAAEVPDPMPNADLTTMCPGMSNPAGSDASAGGESVRRLLYGDAPGIPQMSDALAMTWIDNGTNVVNYWFAHDVDRYRDAIVGAYAPFAVCVADGATYSERELDAAARKAVELINAGGYAIQGGFSVADRSNRVAIPLEALDAAGRTALEALGPIVPVPFVALLDRPVADLPTWQPPTAGDVAILTSKSRSTAGMSALGSFALQYDREGNCLYGTGPGAGRTALVWPFGFTAQREGEVVVVRNAAGRIVARTGEQVNLGGGGGEVGRSGIANDPGVCGAQEVWIVAP